MEFKVSSRGWGYILEGRGLITKVDLDKAEKLINDCRKSGHLPLDFCREDDGRQTVNLEEITDEDTEEFAQNWVDYLVGRAHEQFTPFSFWEDQEVYIEMTVEKVDLLSLFEPICKRFRIPITNISGWSDINKRAAIMKRFAYWEARGQAVHPSALRRPRSRWPAHLRLYPQQHGRSDQRRWLEPRRSDH